jgi:hypothetical protein
MECCIRSWILGSIDDSVLDLAMDEADPTARDLWVAIEGIFHANKEPRAIFHHLSILPAPEDQGRRSS